MSETDQNIQPEQPATAPEHHQGVAWQASEYIHHQKDTMWFLLFGVVSVIVMVLMYLILKDVFSIVVVALMAVAVIVFANRPPRTLQYQISDDGVSIGQKQYSFEAFRSFSLVEDGAIPSIILDPIQRFMPPITVYFSDQEGQAIVEILSDYLPLREYQPDLVDRFARKIRF